MREVDYLIVGQGIAGSILAYELIKAKKSVCVIDKGHENSASFAAAGVINPLVLKRLTLSWRAEEFIHCAHQFYPEIDSFLNVKSFHPTDLHKLILSKDEEVFWEYRWNKVPLKGIVKRQLKLATNKALTEDFKLGTVENTAWVDLKSLLSSFRRYLKEEGALIEEEFNHLEIENRQYRSVLFDKVVFCEGAQCQSNPFFSHLPFSFNKGELLTIKCPELQLKDIFKKKVFVLPLGNDLYRVGSTYERSFGENYEANEKRDELLGQFKAIFNLDFEVVEQTSGIRPAVRDRRPLMGQHPLLSNFYLFNGLGSRGCLMAPTLSKELIGLMEERKPILKEIDLNRVNRDN